MVLQKKFVVALNLTLIAGLFLCGNQVLASEYKDGKCQSFAPTGKELVIFKATDHEDVGTNQEPKEGSPALTRIFCAEASKDATTIPWLDLQKGSNNFLKLDASWIYKKIVREEYEKGCLDFPNTTDWSTLTNYSTPGAMQYRLTKFFVDTNCSSNSSRRLRYRFDVDSDYGKDVYVYFMKVAGDEEQLPNPVTECSKNNGNKIACTANTQCYWWEAAGSKCVAKADTTVKCSQLSSDLCTLALHCKPGAENTCVDKVTQVDMSKAVDQYIADRYSKPAGYDGPLSDCAFKGSCRSVEDLVQLGVDVANWLFKILAGLGFAFFVYGGVTMIFSFGNAEKVGQGKQILVAATIGIIIAFSAYVLVGFIVKAIGINPDLIQQFN